MPSIQVISQRKHFRTIIKERLKTNYNVFISGSFKDGLRNIQKMDIDLIVIDLQPVHLKSLNWIHTLFRIKNIEKGEISVIYVIDPEWINQPGFLNLVKIKKSLQFFWYNQTIFSDDNAFIFALESYLREKTRELQSLRVASISTYKMNMITKSNHHGQSLIDLSIEFDSEPVSFLPLTNSNTIFLEKLEKSINEDSITVLSGPDGLEQTNLVNFIHNQNNRANPLHIMDMNLIPEYNHDAIIFGLRQKNLPGFKYLDNSLFEMVKKGTVYIKNIDHLKWDSQHNLCEALKNMSYYRDDIKINIKCRFIFSTSVNLEKFVEKGLFRQDLYFLLSSHIITIPTIQERKKDIPLIIDNYKNWFQRKFKKEVIVQPEAKYIILNQNFVGQFNQLYQFLFKIFSLANSEINTDLVNLVLKDDSIAGDKNKSSKGEMEKKPGSPSKFIRENTTSPVQLLFENQGSSFEVEYSLAEMEKQYIIHVLSKNFNNIAESSRILGITRKTLYDKLKKYKINLSLKSTG